MKKNNSSQILSPKNYIRQRVRNLPLFKCLVNEDWSEEGSIAHLVISRKHINGNVTFCTYLVDLKCLGIKDTMYEFNMSGFEFDELVDKLDENLNMIEIDYNLAHNIIYAAWEFGEEIGFEPHQDFLSIAQFMLEEDSENIPVIDIWCGDEEGKPLFVQGPLEDDAMAKMIINRLEKNVGVGNFHYILADDNDLSDEFYDDWDEEEDKFLDDIERFRDEYSEMSHEENRELYLELTQFIEEMEDDDEAFGGSRNDEIEEDRELMARIEALSDLLYYDLVNTKDLKKWIIAWDKEASEYTITNSAFNQMLGLPDSVQIEYEDLSYMTKESDKAELIQYVQERWGELPYVTYLELSLLDDPKEIKEALDQGLMKFPKHALLKIENLSAKISDKKIKKTDFSFKSIFGKRKEITPYEYSKWQSVLLFYFLFNDDLAGIEALKLYLYSGAAPVDSGIEEFLSLLNAIRLSFLRTVLLSY